MLQNHFKIRKPTVANEFNENSKGNEPEKKQNKHKYQ